MSRKKVWLPTECFYCSTKITQLNEHTYDHVIPLSQGGPDQLSNIVDCCFRCNQLKGDKTLANFQSYLKQQLKPLSPLAPQYEYFQQILNTVNECLEESG